MREIPPAKPFRNLRITCLFAAAVVATMCCFGQAAGEELPGEPAANAQIPATPNVPPASATVKQKPPATAANDETDEGPEEPCITGQPSTDPSIDSNKIPRFAKNSPFQDGVKPPESKEKERRMWADSWIWAKAPKFEVERWIGDEPDMKGKYVLIEFWATWCGPCRRSISLLNHFHKKYGDELVVIGICEEDEEATRRLAAEHPETPGIEFYSAVDTRKRMKDKLRVWGIPHVIVLEPDGYVIWEGFPLQPGYELNDAIVERFLEVGRKLRAGQQANAE